MSDEAVVAGGVVVVLGLGDGLGTAAGVAGVEEGFGRIVPVELEEGCSLMRPDCADRFLGGTNNARETSVAKTRK